MSLSLFDSTGPAPKAVRVVACVVVILLALGFSWWVFQGRPKAIQSAYFVDEETGQEFIEPLTAVPPLAGAGGKLTLVRAACYTLDGGKTHAPAYFEKFTADAQAAMQKPPADQMDPPVQEALRAGHLVRLPAHGSPWVPVDSNEGQQVTSDYRKKYGATATLCYP